jgi:hypothetical protein
VTGVDDSVVDDNVTYNVVIGSATSSDLNYNGVDVDDIVLKNVNDDILIGGSIQGSPLSLSGAVTTFAGTTGLSGSTDATGTAAKFNYPYAITTDGNSLYIADTSNNRIRKVEISSGVVTTLAGSSSGSTDGTGTSAKFKTPIGITTDGSNLYVTDKGNHRIRKVEISSGVVTTLAGSSSGSTDGTGTSAKFNDPYGITTDGSNLYVADYRNHTIRKIVISTVEVSTLAGTAGSSGSMDGTGSYAKFNKPTGITTDGINLYVSGYMNHTIRKISISNGIVTTIAGLAGSDGSTDSFGTSARFNQPHGITTDGSALFVTEQLNHLIRRVDISSGEVTTLAGSAGSQGSTNGTGSYAKFNQPTGITSNGSYLFVIERMNNTIRKIQ